MTWRVSYDWNLKDGSELGLASEAPNSAWRGQAPVLGHENVVRVRDITAMPGGDPTGTLTIFLGNYKGTCQIFQSTSLPRFTLLFLEI